MKMFIANCTQQAQDFVYRVPESTAPRMQRIEIGSYIQISGDLNQPQITAIVRQKAPYGLVAAEDIDREKDFIGLFFTVDRHPSLTKMQEVISHNVGVMTERGRKLRQEAAVATSAAIESELPPGSLKQLEMTVVEDRRGNGPNATDPEFAEGVIVDRAHLGPPIETKAGQRRPRRRVA